MNEFEKTFEALDNKDTEAGAELENSDLFTENQEAAEQSAQTDFFQLFDEDSEPEAEETVDNQEESELARKKFILEKTIIRAACVLLATLVVFGCCVLVKNIMTPSIEGVWRLEKVYVKGSEKDAKKVGSSAKEAVYYKFGSDGNFIFTSGTITQKMKWSYADSKGKATDQSTGRLIVYPEDNKAYTTQFKWSCDSDGKLMLETGSESVQINTFSFYDGSEIPEYKMKADKNFKVVNDLLGTWEDKADDQRITLNKDGSYSLSVAGYLTQTGNYTVDAKKKTITLGYVGDGSDGDTGALPYTLKDNNLIIANYEFTKNK